MHPCEKIYHAGANGKIYGDTPGICRITGKPATGVPFIKWVRKTFTDQAFLFPGEIISNEALFCFDESSEIVMKRTGREKPQRFRTYSHIIDKTGRWHCLTKADKKLIFELIVDRAELVCLTDSGQKHLLFKHRPGMWQLDEQFILPDLETFRFLHGKMCRLLELGFSQTEVITGNYLQYRIAKAGIEAWKTLEDTIKPYRGISLFNFTSWLLFITK